MNPAFAFVAEVHAAQKREGLWLARHPFVEAVSGGSADRAALARWVRQIYCTTRSYGEIMESLDPPPPVGLWIDPWRDLDLLVKLGGALGVSPRKMDASEPRLAVRRVQLWMRQHFTIPARHVGAQVCWALVEGMSPEAGARMAEGAARHLGLKAGYLGYFRIAMRSRRDGDRYAANLLNLIPVEQWPSLRTQARFVSRTTVQIYDEIETANR